MSGNLKKLTRDRAGLLILDVQEKLFPHMENSCHFFSNLMKAIKGFQILNLPIVVVEHCPESIGPTLEILKRILGEDQKYFSKRSFSCLEEASLQKEFLNLPINQWVIAGLEAHICVFQSACDFLAHGKQVVVLNDAIASRSLFDFSTSIAEIRDCGGRVSSTETVLFELLKKVDVKEFKEICSLVKSEVTSGCCEGKCQ